MVVNHGRSWSLLHPWSSMVAMVAALTPRLVRVPCVLDRARTILRPAWYLLLIAFQLVDDIIPHVAAWKRSFEHDSAAHAVCLFLWGMDRLANTFFLRGFSAWRDWAARTAISTSYLACPSLRVPKCLYRVTTATVRGLKVGPCALRTSPLLGCAKAKYCACVKSRESGPW